MSRKTTHWEGDFPREKCPKCDHPMIDGDMWPWISCPECGYQKRAGGDWADDRPLFAECLEPQKVTAMLAGRSA